MKKTPAQLRASQNYNQKNKELINKKSLEYSKAYPNRKKINAKRYRDQNKEKLRQRGKKYYQKNKEKIAAKAREKYLRLKNEKEVNKKMFGKKSTKKVEEVVPETADLVVEQPKTIGMPGFTEDVATAPVPAPVVAPVSVPAPIVAPEPVVAPAPVVASVAKEQYQIIGAELLPEGLYKYIIVTNKNLGEVGGVYDA